MSGNERAKYNQSLHHVITFFPERIQTFFAHLSTVTLESIEEIRFRVNRPVEVKTGASRFFLCSEKQINPAYQQDFCLEKRELEEMLYKMLGYSWYAFEEEMRNGYFTIGNGCRVGISGKALVEFGEIRAIKQIYAVNIRISHQVKGCACHVMPFIVDHQKHILSTLLLSPPQMGKTTLLRDIVRILGSGYDDIGPMDISLIDERSEIAGAVDGVPQNDVGLCTDVLDGCPKNKGIIIALRSMSPQVIATDEIGKAEDVDAIEEALNSGVSVIATAHAKNIQEALNRPILRSIIEKHFFKRIVILGNSRGTGSIEKIIDGCSLTPISLFKRGVV